MKPQALCEALVTAGDLKGAGLADERVHEEALASACLTDDPDDAKGFVRKGGRPQERQAVLIRRQLAAVSVLHQRHRLSLHWRRRHRLGKVVKD